MTDTPETGIDTDDGFDDDFVLGAPPVMPEEVWESALNAAFNSTGVDEDLYPDGPASPEDGSDVEALQTIHPDDYGPAGFDGGQEQEWLENRDDDHGHY